MVNFKPKLKRIDMIRSTRILCILGFLTFFSSCKNEGAKDADPTAEITKDSVVKAKPKVLTEEDKKQINSVMTKLMVTPELKTFTSTLVSARLTDLLSKEEGPFTVFAPTDGAFGKMATAEKNDLLNPANVEQLIAFLKGHIANGSMNSTDMVQAIRKDGSVKLETLNEAELTIRQQGDELVVESEDGSTAVIGKSDIAGSNGFVHVVDNFLK